MNILQINKFYYPKGGADKHFLDLIELLENKGHNVIVFSTKNKNNQRNKYSKYWLKYYDLSINSKHQFKNVIKFFYNNEAVKKLKQLLKKNKVDIAHIHNIYHHLTPGILKVLKDNNIPIIMTIHDYKLICPNYSLFNFQKQEICEKCKTENYFNCFKNKCVQNSKAKSLIGTLEMYFQKVFFPYHKLVDKFIAPSSFIKQKLIEFNFSNNNIEVLHNFIQSDNRNENPKLGNYFLYYGRLSKEKGLEKFIKVLPKFKKDYKFYIAGKGPEEDNLKTLSNNLNLNNKIQFLGFYNNERKNELNKLINNAQFIIVPSIWYENCSMVILESMAKGKTVLVSDIGGNSELIKSMKNGVLYNLSNEQGLLNKLNILIENKDLLNELGNNARENVKLRFNCNQYYNKLIEIYKDVTITLA